MLIADIVGSWMIDYDYVILTSRKVSAIEVTDVLLSEQRTHHHTNPNNNRERKYNDENPYTLVLSSSSLE